MTTRETPDGQAVRSNPLLGSYSFKWQQGGFVVLTVPHHDEFGERVLITHGLSISTARELHAQLTAVLDMIKADAAALVAAHPKPNASATVAPHAAGGA